MLPNLVNSENMYCFSWLVLEICSFAKAPDAARMDWSAFTKGYFLNRDSLVGVLLLIDASVPPQKIDLDCANWLARNNVCFASLCYNHLCCFKFMLLVQGKLGSLLEAFHVIKSTLVLRNLVFG